MDSRSIHEIIARRGLTARPRAIESLLKYLAEVSDPEVALAKMLENIAVGLQRDGAYLKVTTAVCLAACFTLSYLEKIFPVRLLSSYSRSPFNSTPPFPQMVAPLSLNQIMSNVLSQKPLVMKPISLMKQSLFSLLSTHTNGVMMVLADLFHMQVLLFISMRPPHHVSLC